MRKKSTDPGTNEPPPKVVYPVLVSRKIAIFLSAWRKLNVTLEPRWIPAVRPSAETVLSGLGDLETEVACIAEIRGLCRRAGIRNGVGGGFPPLLVRRKGGGHASGKAEARNLSVR